MHKKTPFWGILKEYCIERGIPPRESLRENPKTLLPIAEREGFEPPETLLPQRFSRPPLSTTQPSLSEKNYTVRTATFKKRVIKLLK
jgi:hypothetical protein